jgi:hypothetical protein
VFCPTRRTLDSDAAKPAPSATGAAWVIPAVALWLAFAASGLAILWAYDNTPGVAAVAADRWPEGSRLERATDTSTLVLLAHPQCTCTPASLGELAEVLARVRTPPRTFVVFLKPSTFPDGWEKTALWQAAARLPNVAVVRDVDGVEAREFGGATSGQTFLYDNEGALQFSGGITSARGHAGDNPGRAALISLLNRLATNHRRTKVFGCPLFASAN